MNLDFTPPEPGDFTTVEPEEFFGSSDFVPRLVEQDTYSSESALDRMEIATRDPASPVSETVQFISSLFPDSHIELNEQAGYLAYSRRGASVDPDRFDTMLIELVSNHKDLQSRPFIVVLDHNPKKNRMGSEIEWLHESNIVGPHLSSTLLGKYYGRLWVGMENGSFLNQAERENVLDSFADSASSKRILCIDHHFGTPLLDGVTTVMLAIDLIKRLHQREELGLLSRLSRAFLEVDHFDADIVLSSFLLRNAGNVELFQDEETLSLLRDASRLNDQQYTPEGSPKRERDTVSIFFNIMVGFEAALSSGEMTLSAVLDRIPAAISYSKRLGQFYSPKDFVGIYLNTRIDETDLLDRFEYAKRLYDLDLKIVVPILHAFEESPTILSIEDYKKEAAAIPNSVVQVGSVLCIDVGSTNGQEVKNTSVMRYLRSKDSPILAKVEVIVLTGEIGEDNGRYVKLRAVRHRDGSHLSLPDLKPYLPSGQLFDNFGVRDIAGSLSKSGLVGLSEKDIQAICVNIAAAVSDLRKSND